jgi:hypothetical protein
MGRFPVRTATATLLVLTLVVAITGIASYFSTGFVFLRAGGYAGQIAVERGRLSLTAFIHQKPGPASYAAHLGGPTRTGDPLLQSLTFDRRWGAAYIGAPQPQNLRYRFHQVYVPMWALLAPLVGLAAWGVVRCRRLPRRIRLRLCTACGYDVRHCVETCSECGTPIAAPPAVASAPAS